MSARQPPLARLLLLAFLLLVFDGTAAQANWATGLAINSSGESAADSAPTAPTAVTSACTSGVGATVKVTWAAVPRASSYEIWQSQTSATSGFSVAATGVTGTSWTSGNLATGTYWFETSALIGSNWTSPNSAATAERIIAALLCT